VPTAVLPRALAALALAAGVVIALLPPPAGTPAAAMPAAGLCLAAVGLWATGVLPEHVTSVAFFLVAVLFALAPPPVVFAGFSSMAFWLVFGGIFIGLAVRRTGLGERLARSLLRFVGGSYFAVIAGIVVVGVALAFVVPSTMARLLILIPVVLALAERLDFRPQSRGRDGMVLASVFGTFMPACGILPSNVANMVLAGNTEILYGQTFSYGDYLLIHFPVVGVLRAATIVLAVWAMFRATPRPAPEGTAAGPPSADERRLAVVLGVALVLWMTDFLHHISPAWVAVGAALVCLLPRVGFLPPTVFSEFRASSLFYVAGVLGMGQLIAETGVGDMLGHALIRQVDLGPGSDAYNFAALVGISTLLGPMTTVPGVAAVMAPLAGELADATQLPLTTVLMTQTIGYSTILLPHQLAPFIVALQLGSVRMAPALRLTAVMALLIAFVLDPVNYLWWRWLGLFG